MSILPKSSFGYPARNLAIAVPEWGAISQTFVRQHVEYLAPAHTALINFGDGPQVDDIPLLRIRLAEFGASPGFANKAKRYFSLAIFGTTTPITCADRDHVWRFLEEQNVGTVLAEFGPVACWLSSVRLPSKIKMFVHFHGYDASGEARYWQSRFSYRHLARRVAGAIAPSQALASELQKLGFGRSQLHVIPYGIDLEDFSPGEGQEKAGPILAVGRLVEKKGPLFTIEAFSYLAQRQKDARLVIIGDGPLLSDCAAKIRELGLVENVDLRGACDHSAVRAAMRSASIFVQHSVTASDGDMEGMPVSILEAMTCGLPVVSTRHSGIPEAVVDGETGLLVEEGDIRGMSLALLRLYQDPDKCKTMGAAGRDRARALYSRELSIRKLREVLQLNVEGS